MSYDYGLGSTIGSLIAGAAILGILIIVLAIVMYIFQALGLYTISKRRGLSLSGFAWVPILFDWKLGHVADDIKLRQEGKTTYYRWLLLGFWGAGFLCNLINSIVSASRAARMLYSYSYEYYPGSIAGSAVLAIFGWGLLIAGVVFYHICLYHVYKSCTEHYVVMLVLGIIFTVLPPFFLFAIRNGNRPNTASGNISYGNNPGYGSSWQGGSQYSSPAGQNQQNQSYQGNSFNQNQPYYSNSDYDYYQKNNNDPSQVYSESYYQNNDPETTLLSAIEDETTLLSHSMSGGFLTYGKTGARIDVNTAEFIIGRERTRTNYCITGNTSVGRVHAKIISRNGNSFLVDLQSANGTYLNGVKCVPFQEMPLKSGDVIVLSNEEFVYQK